MVKYTAVNSGDIEERSGKISKTNNIILFKGKEFRFKKKFHSKRLKKNFHVFYCKENRQCGCNVHIRVDRLCLPRVYYISDHIHDHSRKIKPGSKIRSVRKVPPFFSNSSSSQGLVSFPYPLAISNDRGNMYDKSIVPPPPPPSTGSSKINVVPAVNRRNNPLPKEIMQNKQEKTSPAIHVLNPSMGDVKGGQRVDIFFTVSRDQLMSRFLTTHNSKIATFHFGKNIAKTFGMFELFSNFFNPDYFKSMNPSVFAKCSKSRFVAHCLSPSVKKECVVDVSLSLHNKRVKITNGFKYEKNDTFIQDNKFLNDHQLFMNKISLEQPEEHILANYTFSVDLFGGNILHYATAQNKLKLVKLLVGRGIHSHDQKDISGTSSFDVAKYFKRIEIEKSSNFS